MACSTSILPISWQQNNRSKMSPQNLLRGYPGIPSSAPNLPPILRLQQGWSWKGWEQEFLWRSCHSAPTPSTCLFHKGEEEGSFIPMLWDLVGRFQETTQYTAVCLGWDSWSQANEQRSEKVSVNCTLHREGCKERSFSTTVGLLGARLEPSSKRPCSQEVYHSESGEVEGPVLQVWEFVL